MTTKPYTKYQVAYEAETSNPKEHCSICKHYARSIWKRAYGSCEIVQGKINPKGWCKEFKK